MTKHENSGGGEKSVQQTSEISLKFYEKLDPMDSMYVFWRNASIITSFQMLDIH